MNENDDLLSFLVEGLIAPHRDLVTRAFYKCAQGDPNSQPVNEAILLTAFSRRMALAPKELREAIAEFRKLLAEKWEKEARHRERVELSNAGVIAAFKDEASRAGSNLRATHQLNESTLKEAREMVRTTEAVNVHAEELATKLRLLNHDFQEHHL